MTLSLHNIRLALIEAVAGRDVLVVTWQTEDVLEARPDLERAEARKVLAEVRRRYDFTCGIDWACLESAAFDLYPAPDKTESSAMSERLDVYTAAMIAEGVCDPTSEAQWIEAWQLLHDSGAAYQLPGRIGRMARDLLEAGVIIDSEEVQP